MISTNVKANEYDAAKTGSRLPPNNPLCQCYQTSLGHTLWKLFKHLLGSISGDSPQAQRAGPVARPVVL